MFEISVKTLAIKTGFGGIGELGKQHHLFEPGRFMVTALVFEIAVFQQIGAFFVAPEH